MSVNKLEWPASSIEFGWFFEAWKREGGAVEDVDDDLIWKGGEMASKAWKANLTREAMKRAWEQREEYEDVMRRFEEREEARKHKAVVEEAKRRLRKEVWDEVKGEIMIDIKGKIKGAHHRCLKKKQWAIRKKIRG